MILVMLHDKFDERSHPVLTLSFLVVFLSLFFFFFNVYYSLDKSLKRSRPQFHLNLLGEFPGFPGVVRVARLDMRKKFGVESFIESTDSS